VNVGKIISPSASKYRDLHEFGALGKTVSLAEAKAKVRMKRTWQKKNYCDTEHSLSITHAV